MREKGNLCFLLSCEELKKDTFKKKKKKRRRKNGNSRALSQFYNNDSTAEHTNKLSVMGIWNSFSMAVCASSLMSCSSSSFSRYLVKNRPPKSSCTQAHLSAHSPLEPEDFSAKTSQTQNKGHDLMQLLNFSQANPCFTVHLRAGPRIPFVCQWSLVFGCWKLY